MNADFLYRFVKCIPRLFIAAGLALMPLIIPQTSDAQVDIAIDPLISGLAEPVDITHAGDGSGRLFIVERSGRIRIWDGAALLPGAFLDISGLTTTDSERGLLGMAFHPLFSANGRFFVHYTDLNGDTVLAEYLLGPDPNLADPGSATILLQVPQPFTNHNGGQIRFGPDGFFYMAIGDGGSGGDPLNNGQDLNSLLGKILRIDVDGPRPYAIPADNPLIGQAGARSEIWSYGLRNPWRFSFDRLTGDLFIADVGQNRMEEVNFQPANSAGGENYGWRLMEGSLCFEPPTGCNAAANLTLPILEYARSIGQSVTGGHVYRGQQFPELVGHYIFGDFSSGRVFVAEQQPGGQWAVVTTLETPHFISAFGEDQDGEIYVASFDIATGTVFRITTAPPQVSDPAPPADDVGTGSGPGPGNGAPAATGNGGGGGGCMVETLLNP